MDDFLKEFRKLTNPLFEDPASPSMGGQADLAPLRNKAREAMDALADAGRAADQGRADDCLESFRRAKASIDAALGGQIGPYSPQGSQMAPGSVPPTGTRP